MFVPELPAPSKLSSLENIARHFHSRRFVAPWLLRNGHAMTILGA